MHYMANLEGGRPLNEQACYESRIPKRTPTIGNSEEERQTLVFTSAR